MRRILVLLFIVGYVAASSGLVHGADKLRVGIPSLATALSPTWVAAKKGFWKKHDLEVELILLSGAVIISTLLSGNLDVVIGSDTSVAIANLKGANILRLGVTTNSLGSSLVTQQNVDSIKQLKGKVIGIGSQGFSSLELRLSKLLLDHGIDPEKDVKFLPIGGSPSARVAALEKGLVIAAMITPPYDLVARESGMKLLAKIDAPVIAGGINVKDDYLAGNRQKLLRFLKGYTEGIHFLVNNKTETIKIFSDYLGARDAKVLGYFYNEIAGRVEKSLRPDPESIRFTLDFIGRIYPKAKEIKVTDYSDLSLVEEIQKSGFMEQLYPGAARR
jgi:ABC-type nitrate/sulfonate/bicarbonate transport system substrate-binding protein